MSRREVRVERGEYPLPPPSKCAKVLYYTWKLCSVMFSHFVMISLVVAYCILGAATFEKLEAEHEREVKKNISQIRNNTTQSIWSMTRAVPLLNQTNWTCEVVDMLQDFENAILLEMKVRGWDGNESTDSIQWTFTGALFYSIIVITTIGYGHIAPKTQTGKVVTIFYAILGIPLMLLCLSNIGDVMASSFRFLYWRVCCYVCTRPPKRRHRHHASSRRSVRGGSVRGSTRRRPRPIERAHSDTDCRYRDSGYSSGRPRRPRGPPSLPAHTMSLPRTRSQPPPHARLDRPYGPKDYEPEEPSPVRYDKYERSRDTYDEEEEEFPKISLPLQDLEAALKDLEHHQMKVPSKPELRSKSLPRPAKAKPEFGPRRDFEEQRHFDDEPKDMYEMHDLHDVDYENYKERKALERERRREREDMYGLRDRGYDPEDEDFEFDYPRGRSSKRDWRSERGRSEYLERDRDREDPWDRRSRRARSAIYDYEHQWQDERPPQPTHQVRPLRRLHTVDDSRSHYRHECGLIESCADLPSQDDISGTALDKIYELTLKNIKTQIVSDNPLRISRHSNIWIDYFRQQIYLTNSIHYLTADFELKSFTLKTQVVDERQYTEVNERINKEFGLHYKDTTRYNCLGYAFHCLVIDDGIKKTPETFKLVQKCKSIILEVSRYITELQTETPQQKQLLASFGIIAEIIKRDSNDLFICDLPSNHRTFLTNNVSKACETTSSIPLRWHINLKMLESIKCCGSSSTINKVLETIKRDVLQIVPDEWNLLENLIQFLSKFQLVVEILSSEKSCTINLVLLIKTMIKEVLMEENSLDLRSLKDNMLKNLDDKFLTRRIDVAAALLDSRFIELKEVSAYLQNKTRVTFLAEFIKEIHDELQNIPSKQKSAKIKSRRLSYVSEISRKYNMFDDPHCATYEEIKREVRKYFEVVNPAELDNANLLDYWKSKKNTFPWLSYLARAILCIPAINIPCERMLTMAGQQFTTKRSRLSPHSLDKSPSLDRDDWSDEVVPRRGRPPQAWSSRQSDIYHPPSDVAAKEQIKPVPIWLCVFLVASYIVAGTFLFKRWESWSYLDAAYFCFITLTTIGFGDFVPAQGRRKEEHPDDSREAENDAAAAVHSIALCSLYLLFGIALLAMSFNLVQEEVRANVAALATKLGIIKPRDTHQDSDTE